MPATIGAVSTPILPEKFAPVREFLEGQAKEAGMPVDQMLTKMGEQLKEISAKDLEEARGKIGVASYVRVDPADQEYIANGLRNAGVVSAELLQLGVGAIAIGAVMQPIFGDSMQMNF